MKRLAAVVLILAGVLLGWAQEKTKKSAPPAATTAPAVNREPGLYATLDTSMGQIVIRLYEKEAPKTVANFVELATGKKPWREMRSPQPVVGKPFYDGIIFHRVIPNFMAQTGAHLPDGNARLAAAIPDEIHPDLKYDRPGRVGMANRGPNTGTGTSQFFITHVPVPQLNGGYAIFGQVVEGQEVVNKMATVKLLPNEMGENARPDPPILLHRVTIERVDAAPGSAAKPK